MAEGKRGEMVHVTTDRDLAFERRLTPGQLAIYRQRLDLHAIRQAVAKKLTAPDEKVPVYQALAHQRRAIQGFEARKSKIEFDHKTNPASIIQEALIRKIGEERDDSYSQNPDMAAYLLASLDQSIRTLEGGLLIVKGKMLVSGKGQPDPTLALVHEALKQKLVSHELLSYPPTKKTSGREIVDEQIVAAVLQGMEILPKKPGYVYLAEDLAEISKKQPSESEGHIRPIETDSGLSYEITSPNQSFEGLVATLKLTSGGFLTGFALTASDQALARMADKTSGYFPATSSTSFRRR